MIFHCNRLNLVPRYPCWLLVFCQVMLPRPFIVLLIVCLVSTVYSPNTSSIQKRTCFALISMSMFIMHIRFHATVSIIWIPYPCGVFMILVSHVWLGGVECPYLLQGEEQAAGWLAGQTCKGLNFPCFEIKLYQSACITSSH